MSASSQQSVHHPLFARAFEKIGAAAGKRGQNEHREKMLAGAARSVIEVGAGNGLNFPFYPPEVDRVLAVEPEAYPAFTTTSKPRSRACASSSAQSSQSGSTPPADAT